ncbi:MAG: hypothetical protein JSS79_07830 [Bacteroidetes bacterium]|nr:hypothetical protein [Bacteroidota bacterium]
MKLVFFTLIFFVSATLLAQRSPNLSADHFQEGAYLHTDKHYYYPGETIWFSAYMSYRSPGMADTLSRVLYVELINPAREIAKSALVKLDSGRGSGVLNLESSLPPGNYIIRAYTSWMRNYGVSHFFYKPIPVLDPYYTVSEKTPQVPEVDDHLKIFSDKRVYKTREKVKLLILLDNERKGNLKSASFSVSVTDEDQVVPVGGSQTIMNDYQLSDGLPPDMLPHFKYPVESGIWMKGVHLSRKNRGEKRTLTVVQDKLAGLFKVEANDTGVFILKDLMIYDTTKFIVNGNRGKVFLLPQDYPALPKELPGHHLHLMRTDSVHRSVDPNLKSEMLNEVVVTTTRRAKQYDSPYGTPDVVLAGEQMNGYSSLAAAIVAKVPQFTLVSSNGHLLLMWVRGMFIAGAGEPVVYIDQAQVITGSGETVGDRLDQMNPAMIDHIEVSSMINSGLGANGVNGLIYVSTRKQSLATGTTNPLLKLRGFDSPIRFESPNYSTPTTDTSQPDLRATIYWNPKITLNVNRPTMEISFYTADRPGKYRVIVEGLKNRTIPTRKEILLTVE